MSNKPSLPTNDVPKALGIMMLAFRERSGGEVAAAYLAALSHLPAEAICHAIGQFVRGEVDRNHAFAPSAAEIADLSARIADYNSFWERLLEDSPGMALDIVTRKNDSPLLYPRIKQVVLGLAVPQVESLQ